MRVDRLGLRGAALRGFAADAEAVSVAADGEAVVVRGTSDRRWTYAALLDPSRPPSDALIAMLAADRDFAALDPALADPLVVALRAAGHAVQVSAGVTLAWTAPGLPPIVLPPGYRQRALHARDVSRVDAAWIHRGPGTDALLERAVARGPTVGTETAAGELIAWGVVLDDRAIGACAVEPAHRGRGLHVAQIARLVSTVRARDWTVMQHVTPEQAPAWEARGWTRAAEARWISAQVSAG